MSEPTSPPYPKRNPLDYGQQPKKIIAGWARARAAVQERLDGFFEFIGILIAAAGGYRQVILAFALCSLFGGLGMAIEHDYYLSFGGHRWMAFGGFLLGLVIKLK